MEGQRHGYQNLTVGITYTAPGGAPPMHTHAGEEAHVLLDGEILYALGDELFTITGPYIVNIPPMVPHSFVNIGEGLAELVVIFPTNVWEYDVLDYFPFKDLDAAKKRARRSTRRRLHDPPPLRARHTFSGDRGLIPVVRIVNASCSTVKLDGCGHASCAAPG